MMNGVQLYRAESEAVRLCREITEVGDIDHVATHSIVVIQTSLEI